MKALICLAHSNLPTETSRLSSVHLPLRNHHLIVRLHLIPTGAHMRRRDLANVSQHREHSRRLIHIVVACAIEAESSDATARGLQGVKVGVIATVDAHDHEPSTATGSSVVPNQDIAWDLIASSEVHHFVVVGSCLVRQPKWSVMTAIKMLSTSWVLLCLIFPFAFVCLSFRAQACFILLFGQLAHLLLRNLGDWIFACRD